MTLVLRGDRLVGAQVMGRTERLGPLMANIMAGGELVEGEPRTARQLREGWHLRGVRRELAELLSREAA
jgi:hypothetical protein